MSILTKFCRDSDEQPTQILTPSSTILPHLAAGHDVNKCANFQEFILRNKNMSAQRSVFKGVHPNVL